MRIAILALLVGSSLAVPAPQEDDGATNRVFSYETMGEYGDVTGYHYQNGDPGVNVNGGFGFTDAEGVSHDLTFVADENGYQPSADFLPQPVTETAEVREARANFYSLWDAIAAEHKALMEAAANNGDDNGEYNSGVDAYAADSEEDAGDVDLRTGGGLDFDKRRKKRQVSVFPYHHLTPVVYRTPQVVYPVVQRPLPMVRVLPYEPLVRAPIKKRPVDKKKKSERPLPPFGIAEVHRPSGVLAL